MASLIKHKIITYVNRLVDAFCYSCSGLSTAWVKEAAFRQASILAAILISIAWIFEPNWLSRSLLFIVTLLIPIVELINSSIEAAVDHTSLQHHALAKAAKDMASAAQLLSLVLLILVWLSWLWP